MAQTEKPQRADSGRKEVRAERVWNTCGSGINEQGKGYRQGSERAMGWMTGFEFHRSHP
jgi:hypothetical protein